MRCDDVRENLVAWLDGELGCAEAQRLEEALSRDERLAGELADLRAARKLVGDLPRKVPDKGFTSRVLTLAGRRATAPRNRRSWAPYAAAAAVLIAARHRDNFVTEPVLGPGFETPDTG